MPQPIDNIDLDFLSDTERDLILEVLRRDEVLRQAEEQRIRKLKAELLEIKRKGAKRGSIRYSQRSCARCHGSLSLLAFSSNHCQCCHHLVCRKCRANLPDGSWLCSVCVKESDMRKSTGDWFYNLRVNRFSTMPGHELVRSSLRKRPAMKKYATMGDVLLRNSDSSRGPPVPVPRHKVSATDKRPSSENSDSVTSTASFEPKEDGIFSHGPPSEYSGSVASTVSFERKGIDDLFKPSQSDAELSELTSLTSSKTGHESGRVTPDLPRRAVLPPHYNQSSVTLLPDAISIHSYSCEAEAAPEINQAIPSQEFDVDKLFKKSIQHVHDPPDDGMDVGKQPDSYKVPVEVKSQFGQLLDTQVPKIKQANQMPELDVEKFSRKSVKHFENPPEFVKHGLDICDRPDSYEVAVAAKRQFERDFDMQVPEIEQAVPSREFDVDEHFKTVNNIENHPERANIGLEVSDQSHSYQNLADIKTQSVHGLAMEVTEIKQVSPNPEFDVENLSRKGLKHIENPPACVENEPDVCDQPHSHAIPVPAPRQFVKGLNTQVPKMKQASSSPEFDGDELFKKSVKNIENPPDCLKYGLEVCDQPDMYETVLDVTSQFEQSLDTQNPEIKQVCPSPELDVQKLFKKSVTRTQNIHEHHSTLDLRDNRDTLTVPMGNRSQSVPDLDMQDDEEEDIDSLVNTHRNSMASSASSMSVSMTSIYSDSGDSYSVDVRGEVVFSMFYDEPTQSLQVLIKECRKLACGDSLRQFSNPYVKCYLLPDKSRQSKRKTTIKRHTCDPVYEETFKYNIRRNQLLTRSMLISVWHHGHLGSNPFLGEVEIALDCYDLDCPQEECMALMTKAPCCIPASAFTQFKGELMISLKYVTPKGPRLQKFKGKKVVEVEGGELHILIKEAKNLMAMKGGGGTSDSFVKGYLFPSKSKTTKRKTPVVKKSLNPHYGHTFVYKELTLEQLRTMCLELTVWDREPMLSNEFLGGVRLSSGEGTVKIGNQEVEMDSVGEEVSLWKKMMQYPDSWAEGTLPLRTTMRKKKGK
ncbi:synaptotagmin-like protein 4 isoform X11 [Hippocampus comes]|uniref:synaptotagmin-like protein 4 isoform X11 n=1 Tax=Hippocampus comes TaxID=109280 RepID=UPI00094EB097|nr:PREDICTED: synaptotagmin-like protein 4 isoform X11 [Hippocampus comes]